MSNTYVEFDCSPTDETGVSVSKTEEYMPKMREEANRMIDLLETKFQDAPGEFKRSRCEHDFGPYLEIRYCFTDDEYNWKWANFIESNWPVTWGDNTVMTID